MDKTPAWSILLVTLLFTAVGSVQAEWKDIGHANEQRYEATTVLHNGKMIVLNGFSPTIDIVNSVEVFDPANNSWELKTTTEAGLGNAVTHVGSVVAGDDVWIIGGRVGNSPGYVSDKVWIYSTTKNNWREGPALPVPFAGGGAALINNRIHVFGGLDSKAQCDVDHHFVHDIGSDSGWQDITATAAMPLARNHFSTVVYQNKIYAFGGQNNHDQCGNQQSKEVSYAHVFTPYTNEWTRLTDLPFPRSHAEPGTFAYNDDILIVGGSSQGEKIISFDPHSNTWEVLDWLELPYPLMAPAARIIGNTFYVAMGGEGGNTNATSTTRAMELPGYFLLNPDAETNSNIPNPTRPQGWTDSYAVDGQCYCDSNFDHQIGEINFATPFGVKKVEQICSDIKAVKGEGSINGRIYYNTIQCGSGPINLDLINDEWTCPGIPRGFKDYTGDRCFEKGATWNLDSIYSDAVVAETPETPEIGATEDPVQEGIPVATSSSNESTVVYRINAGGPALSSDSGNWAADNNGGSLANTGNIWKKASSINTSSLPDDVPKAIFQTERWDNSSAPALQWALPVSAGKYEVRLYFAELWVGAFSKGARVFDVNVEGQVRRGIDVFAQAGSNTGLMETFTIDSDDTINITFSHVRQNPAVKGIEVIRLMSADAPVPPILPVNAAPTVEAGPNKTVTTGTPLNLIATVNDDGHPTNTLTHQWLVVSGPGNTQFTDSTNAETAVIFNDAGTYILQLETSDGDLSGTDEVEITVEAPVTAPPTTPATPAVPAPPIVPTTPVVPATPIVPTTPVVPAPVPGTPPIAGTIVYRINAGGPALSTESGTWMADDKGSNYVNTGSIWKNTSAINTAAVPDYVPESLFQTERWDNSRAPALQWVLPVSPGKYQVRLYFAELWSGAFRKGTRIFDVNVEGQKLDSLDVFSKVGGNTALMESFIIDSDNTIEITFSHGKQNPAIKGIEVILLAADTSVVEVTPILPVNVAPDVNAGVNKTVAIDTLLTLIGSVNDHDLPVNTLTHKWSKVSGPGNVQFTDSTNSETSVSFDVSGTYILRLTSHDGDLSGSDDVDITVEAPATATPIPVTPTEPEAPVVPPNVPATPSAPAIDVPDTPSTMAATVVYRINAGGPAVSSPSGDWMADNNDSSLVNTGNTWTRTSKVNTAGVPGYIPEALFHTERWDNLSTPGLQWTLPVSPGKYEVRLYFAEIWTGAFSSGKRIFDVDVEGQLLNGLDIFAQVGGNTALMKDFVIDSDDAINITFSHVKQNPAIKGIEVIRLDPASVQSNL